MLFRKSLLTLLTIAVLTTMLTACSAKPTEDPTAKFTEIASTVQAELTRVAILTPSATATPEATATATATLLPVTNTPSGPTGTPANTPLPTSGPGNTSGDNSMFVGDITIGDGTVFLPGTEFTKTWRFYNIGNTTWTTDYKLVFFEGTVQGTGDLVAVNLPKEVPPGVSMNISVKFTAPGTEGNYISKWILYSPTNGFFGEYCSTKFSVGPVAKTVDVAPLLSAPTPIP